jgi:hypothetical protein
VTAANFRQESRRLPAATSFSRADRRGVKEPWYLACSGTRVTREEERDNDDCKRAFFLNLDSILLIVERETTPMLVFDPALKGVA